MSPADHVRSCVAKLILLVVSMTLVACERDHEMSISETEVQILEDRSGRGKPAKDGDIVCIDFQVIVPDEKDRRDIPDGEEVLFSQNFCFELGAEAVIAGFDDSVPGMRAGGSRVVRCPPHKHWGRGGYGGVIPERSSLIFHVKLNSIE